MLRYGGFPCITAGSAASLASAHYMPVALLPLVATTKNVSRGHLGGKDAAAPRLGGTSTRLLLTRCGERLVYSTSALVTYWKDESLEK